MDEMPKQIIGEYQDEIIGSDGIVRYDTEYRRLGTFNVLLAVEPLGGFRHLRIFETKTKEDWAQFTQETAEKYPFAKKITLVCDNLNTHGQGSWYKKFHNEEAKRLMEHCLRPHRNRYFLQITDPNFFPKMERLIELYKNPPKNFFCFDECPGIQILQRIAPDLRPGDDESIRVWWKEFEYIRNGTTDLFAFLEVETGKMSVSCHADHTKNTFLSVVSDLIASLREDEPINLLMDNLASHCCYEFCELVARASGIECPDANQLDRQEKRREWLQRKDKRVVLHFTPFHGSWLNMAEICFRLIGDKCLKDSYSSPAQLHDAIYAFVKRWNERWAHPFTWKYDGAGLHSKAVQRFTAVLTRSPEAMTLQFMTKECRLMTNLIYDYTQFVSPAHWTRLAEAVVGCQKILRESISQSAQPIVKKNAAAALDKLLEILPTVICEIALAA
jgi:hypothetical protein